MPAATGVVQDAGRVHGPRPADRVADGAQRFIRIDVGRMENRAAGRARRRRQVGEIGMPIRGFGRKSDNQ